MVPVHPRHELQLLGLETGIHAFPLGPGLMIMIMLNHLHFSIGHVHWLHVKKQAGPTTENGGKAEHCPNPQHMAGSPPVADFTTHSQHQESTHEAAVTPNYCPAARLFVAASVGYHHTTALLP